MSDQKNKEKPLTVQEVAAKYSGYHIPEWMVLAMKDYAAQQVAAALADPKHRIAKACAEHFPMEGIPDTWNRLWSEVEMWYGDISKERESHADFLKRMQTVFSLAALADKKEPRISDEAIQHRDTHRDIMVDLHKREMEHDGGVLSFKKGFNEGYELAYKDQCQLNADLTKATAALREELEQVKDSVGSDRPTWDSYNHAVDETGEANNRIEELEKELEAVKKGRDELRNADTTKWSDMEHPPPPSSPGARTSERVIVMIRGDFIGYGRYDHKLGRWRANMGAFQWTYIPK